MNATERKIGEENRDIEEDEDDDDMGSDDDLDLGDDEEVDCTFTSIFYYHARLLICARNLASR